MHLYMGFFEATGSMPRPGQQEYSVLSSLGCVIAYDLEVDSPYISRGGLPLPTDTVVCCSVVCTCGYKASWTLGATSEKYINGSDSCDVLLKSIEAIEYHLPVWLIGHNRYSFDNLYYACQLPLELSERVTKYISVSKQSKVSFSYY